MKKIILMICFIGLLVISPRGSFAYEDDDLIFSKNHLDLRNLYVDPITDMAMTIDPIEVTAHQTYTLILSYGFLGQWENAYYDEQLGVRSLPGSTYVSYDFIIDDINEVFYVEFIPTTNQILINEIPINAYSYEAILIHGNYASFKGFMPFLHAGTTLATEKVILMDYDNRLTLDDIKLHITAKSAYNELIDYDVTFDAFSTSNQLPGTYHIRFLALHQHMYQYLNLEIRILDITPPTMSFAGHKVIIPLAQKLELDAIKDLISIQDNVDSLDKSHLTITSNTYSTAQTVGNYHISFKISDFSGNETSLYMPIELVDLQGPLIDGPDLIFIYTEDEPFTYAQILSYFEIYDDVDGYDVTTQVITDQYQQTRLPGKYLIQIESRDTQNNMTRKNIMVHVIHNSPPIFELTDLFLEVSTIHEMSESELIDWFKASLLSSGINAEGVNITFNEYKLKPNQAGEYFVYMSYSVGEEAHVSRIMVHVIETKDPPLHFSVYGLIAIPALAISFVIVKKIKK